MTEKENKKIIICHPVGWDGYVYHGTVDVKIESNCPICGNPLHIWWGRWYDGTLYDQITGCSGTCDPNDIYAKIKEIAS